MKSDQALKPAMEAAMIGKESGQDGLAAWGLEHKPGMLDRINEELDWRHFGKHLHRVFKDSKGGSPLLSSSGAVQGIAAPAMVRAE